MKKFKPGDRVIDTQWRSRPAAVATCARVYARLRYDESPGEVKSARIEDLRAETPADVSKREHAKALAEWRDSRPATAVAKVDYGSSYSTSQDARGASATARTPGEMRQAAREMLEIADWFDRKPVVPS